MGRCSRSGHTLRTMTSGADIDVVIRPLGGCTGAFFFKFYGHQPQNWWSVGADVPQVRWRTKCRGWEEEEDGVFLESPRHRERCSSVVPPSHPRGSAVKSFGFGGGTPSVPPRCDSFLRGSRSTQQPAFDTAALDCSAALFLTVPSDLAFSALVPTLRQSNRPLAGLASINELADWPRVFRPRRVLS